MNLLLSVVLVVMVLLLLVVINVPQVLSNELQSRIDQFKNLHVSFTQH